MPRIFSLIITLFALIAPPASAAVPSPEARLRASLAPAAPIPLFYASVEQSDAWNTRANGFYSFAADGRGFSPVGPLAQEAITVTDGAVYHDGRIYYLRKTVESLFRYSLDWTVVDAETFEVISRTARNGLSLAFDMTYDTTTETCFAASPRSYGEPHADLRRVDLATGEFTTIAQLDVCIRAITADSQGRLWGLGNEVVDGRTTTFFYNINKETGVLTRIGDVGYTMQDTDAALTCDLRDDCIYWAAHTYTDDEHLQRTYRRGLATIDVETGSATFVYDFPANEKLSSLFINTDHPAGFNDPTPLPVSDLQLTPKDAATTAVLTWTAPTACVDRVTPLDPSRLTYTVTRRNDGRIVAQGLTDCRYEDTPDFPMQRVGYTITAVYTPAQASAPAPQASAPQAPALALQVGAPQAAAPSAPAAPALQASAPQAGAPQAPALALQAAAPQAAAPSAPAAPAPTSRFGGFGGDFPAAPSQSLSSAPVQSPLCAIGRPHTIPYLETFDSPTAFYTYTLYDANADMDPDLGNGWFYDQTSQSALYYTTLSRPADDWLVTPTLTISPDRVYRLRFGTYGYMGRGARNTFEVALAADSEQAPAALTAPSAPSAPAAFIAPSALTAPSALIAPSALTALIAPSAPVVPSDASLGAPACPFIFGAPIFTDTYLTEPTSPAFNAAAQPRWYTLLFHPEEGQRRIGIHNISPLDDHMFVDNIYIEDLGPATDFDLDHLNDADPDPDLDTFDDDVLRYVNDLTITEAPESPAAPSPAPAAPSPAPAAPGPALAAPGLAPAAPSLVPAAPGLASAPPASAPTPARHSRFGLFGSDFPSPSVSTPSTPAFPAASDGAAAPSSAAALTWSPATTLPRLKPTLQNCDALTPFTLDGGEGWTTHDADGARTIGIGTNQGALEWPHTTEAQAFIVFNPYCLGVESIIAPHSGEQCFVSFAAAGRASDDWLISPLLSGQQQRLSFWAKCLYPECLNEQFEVWASYDSPDVSAAASAPASAAVPSPEARLRASLAPAALASAPAAASPASAAPASALASASAPAAAAPFRLAGPVTVSSATEWSEFSFILPEGVRYVMIRCVSDSQFGLMIDDLTFPAAPAPTEFWGYNIYCDGQLIVREHPECIFSLSLDPATGITPPAGTYTVTAQYAEGESRHSNPVTYLPAGIHSPVVTPAAPAARVYDLQGRPASSSARGITITPARKQIR